MDEAKLKEVIEKAAAGRACTVKDIVLDDDNNIEVTITRGVAPVDLQDCEFVHRAILKEFDRDVEDYALTVGSEGMSGEEADEMLKTIE